MSVRIAPAYERVRGLISDGRCVLLDGGIATQLPQVASKQRVADERLWGTSALVDDPESVLRGPPRATRRIGCDVITTNTWGLPSALAQDGPQLWELEPAGALDGRGRGADCALARQAVAEAGREGALRRGLLAQRRRGLARRRARPFACCRASFAADAARSHPARDAFAGASRRCTATVEALLGRRACRCG